MAKEIQRQAVIHGPQPVGERERLALGVGNRHEGVLRPAPIDLREILEVETAVQRRHRTLRAMLEKRKLQRFDVEMQDVEFVRPFPDVVEHREMRGHVRFERIRVEPDGLVPHGNQARLGRRICAGEERDVVPELNQSIGKICNDPLSAPVQPGRSRLVQRRDLRNSHGWISGRPIRPADAPD